MKRKIVVCGIFITTVFMLGWPANESFANNGYTSGNAQRLDMLYEQLPDQYKESFKTNMGF